MATVTRMITSFFELVKEIEAIRQDAAQADLSVAVKNLQDSAAKRIAELQADDVPAPVRVVDVAPLAPAPAVIEGDGQPVEVAIKDFSTDFEYAHTANDELL